MVSIEFYSLAAESKIEKIFRRHADSIPMSEGRIDRQSPPFKSRQYSAFSVI
jgi:hypothetical protein